MILDNEFLKEALNIIKEKKYIWEKVTGLKFDENGRVLIGKLKGEKLIFNDFTEYFSGENSIENTSKSFMECFNKYLSDNNLSIYLSKCKIDKVAIFKKLDKQMLEKALIYCKNYESNFFKKVNNINDPADIGLELLFFNKVMISSKHGNHEVKFTKILAEVQKYWEKDNTQYKEIVNKLKKIKYSRIEERDNLIKRKSELEKHNLYFDQQKILNKVYLNGGELWLSINPIDEFTSSGCKYNYKECYPTSFRTCIRNKIRIMNDNVHVESQNDKGNPRQQILLSKIKNKGLIYILNGSKIKNGDVELLGYKLRVNVWLDTNSIFVSKFYPSVDKGKKEEVYNLIKRKTKIKIFDILDIVEGYKLEMQDLNNNKILYESYDKYLQNIYIDDIYIKNNEIYLTKDAFKTIHFIKLKEAFRLYDWKNRIDLKYITTNK